MENECVAVLHYNMRINDLPHCDLCGACFNEGDATFVGMTTTGELVNVSECCRTTLDSIYSRGRYMCSTCDA